LTWETSSRDGVLGLIDAVHRFDEGRGIKFETFAERRIRGAMIDALRKDAWPRGIRRARREIEAAREQLRRELRAEPSMADLAKRVGVAEPQLERMIVRINTIESTSPLANLDTFHSASLPAMLVPSEPASPGHARRTEPDTQRVARLIACPPASADPALYYRQATIKQIGQQIGVVNRVAVHARAIQRLRRLLALAPVAGPRLVAKNSRPKSARPAPARMVARVRHDERRAVA
jgi:RNA polymerase sigma factor for flagellar operon FliA